MAGSPRSKYVQSTQTATVSPQGFNPNGPYYMTCCCHVRKFTVAFAIVEIFVVCFLIVAVIPDISTKICRPHAPADNDTAAATEATTLMPLVQPTWTTPIPLNGATSSSKLSTITFGTTLASPISQNLSSTPPARTKRQAPATAALNNTNSAPTPATTVLSTTSRLSFYDAQILNIQIEANDTGNYSWYSNDGQDNPPLKILYVLSCEMNMVWLFLVLVHIISANLMFFGLKTKKWFLFLPHITCRVLAVLIVVLLLTLLVTGAVFGPPMPGLKLPVWVLLAIGVAFIIPYSFIIYSEVKCAHFVKLSAETGFSISNTRPVGPPTASLSDGRQQQGQGGQNIAMQQLQTPDNANGASDNPLPPLRHTFR